MKSLQNKLKPVNKTSLSEEVASQIIKLISTGDLKPGHKLPPERELCKMLGVGRSSVREALRGLSLLGLLDARLGEGTFIAEDGEKFIGKMFEWRILTERRDIENLLEVRLALESETAYYAASRGTDDHFQQLEEIINKMQSAIENPKGFAPLDLEFHLIIARASDNEIMHELLMMIRGQLERSLFKVLSIPGGGNLALQQHKKIYEAIRKRDPEGAKSYMREHIKSALERYKKTVTKAVNG